MTQAIVATIVGIVISVLIEIIPGFNDWWSKFEYKRAALFGLFLAVPLIWWALACFVPIDIPATGFECDLSGASQSVAVGFIGFLASTGTFKIVTSKLPTAVARNW